MQKLELHVEVYLGNWSYYLLLTYLHHAAVFLEKLTGSQLVNKFPAFYGTQNFITTFKNAHHLSLS